MRASSASSRAAGGWNGAPSASARSRAWRARSAKPCAALSRTPEVARVSSIAQQQLAGLDHLAFRTRISDTTPPSSDCTTCSWRDGITSPSPRVTSSTVRERRPDDQQHHARRRAARTIFCARVRALARHHRVGFVLEAAKAGLAASLSVTSGRAAAGHRLQATRMRSSTRTAWRRQRLGRLGECGVASHVLMRPSRCGRSAALP